jgi:folate-binding protein YgfZ
MAADDNQPMNNAPAVPTAPAPHGALRLTDWGVIRAQGEDARKFLHGQLTQDVEHLSAEAARLAGFCSAKGRLLATFVIWSRGADEVLLACSADLLPTVLKRLSMFVMRAKCKLSDASADLPLWGLAGPLAGVELPATWQLGVQDAGVWIRLPDAVSADGLATARYLGAGVAQPLAPALDAALWAGLEVQSGVARVVAATAEQFVPQMVNLELVGGVNFQKGCYPGQEIVARSQYRGTLKRRAYVVEAAANLAPGEEVFHSADATQPAGMVVLAGRAAGGAALGLVELKIAALDGGTLHAGSVSGPLLTPAAMPYAFPAEAA